MRTLQNTICQRIRALKYVFEQGFASLLDIKSFLNSQADNSSFRVALYQFGLSHLSFHTIPNGVWYIGNPEILRELRQFFPEINRSRPTKINFNEIHHSLGMNKIRHALSHHCRLNIQDWQSEFFIRSLPLYARIEFPYRKIPDGIFTHQKTDGNMKKFFIEFERTSKSKSRYIEIFRHYAKRQDVSNGSVIYVCSDELIRRELRKIVKGLFGRGVINNQEEVFQFVDYQDLITTKDGGLYVK